MNKTTKHFELMTTSDACISSRMYTVKVLSTNAIIKVISYPFENCQTFLISPFYRIFATNLDYKNVVDKIQELMGLCSIYQHLCQIDVQKEVFDNIKEHVSVHCKMSYTNLTGNKMVGALLNI